MDLKRSGREFYTLELVARDNTGTVIPDVTGYETSFDGEDTWVAGVKEVATGFWRWLVAGPIADRGDAVAVITARQVVPATRLVDSPEIVVRDMPPINLRHR